MQRNYLLGWIDQLQAGGKVVFTYKDLTRAFPDKSGTALNQSLSRLSRKGKIVSVYKGFYLIIPPEYSNREMIPPVQFIDYLMEYIGKPYYVGLVSAASFHGAAHQQPQEFFVLTNTKQLVTLKRGVKINYVIKRNIPSEYIESKKTQTGYIKVSSPELTALDLVYYNLRVGGLNRVSTILSELTESMKIENINQGLINLFTTATIQRLGYILEHILEETELADKLWMVLQNLKKRFYRQPLRTGMKSTGFETDPRWQIIVNTDIDSDI